MEVPDASTQAQRRLLRQPTAPSWVGILWIDVYGALVGAIDLRMQVDTAN